MSCRKKSGLSQTIFIQAIIFFTLFLYYAPITLAGGPIYDDTDFIGYWDGYTIGDETPADLTVAQDPYLRPSLSYQFHYGAPKSCVLTGEKVKLEQNILNLVIKETSGGRYCDKLWKGTIVLTLEDRTHLDVWIEGPKHRLKDRAKLVKQ